MSTDTPKRLYRSTSDRIIAGVAGGIAEYFAIDSTLVRIIFVALSFGGGIGVGLYILAWVMVPTRDQASIAEQWLSHRPSKAEAEVQQEFKEAIRTVRVHSSAGLWLILLGLILLVGNFNLISFDTIAKLWPVLLILLGWQILSRRR